MKSWRKRMVIMLSNILRYYRWHDAFVKECRMSTKLKSRPGVPVTKLMEVLVNTVAIIMQENSRLIEWVSINPVVAPRTPNILLTKKLRLCWPNCEYGLLQESEHTINRAHILRKWPEYQGGKWKCHQYDAKPHVLEGYTRIFLFGRRSSSCRIQHTAWT